MVSARLLTEAARDPQLHVLVVLALTTAARAGGQVGLLWADVELDKAYMLLRRTKSEEPRVVWVHGEARGF
jgi:hypothetical protein